MTSPKDLSASRAALAAAWQAAAASDAPLQSQIDAYVAASRDIVPDTIAAYDRMVARLEHAGAGEDAPAVGSNLPDMLLPDSAGRLIALSSLIAEGPLVVSFNRGHWCPYCRLEMLALNKAARMLNATGIQFISIVPETAEFSQRMIETNQLVFPVLSDIDHAYALELALAVWTGAELSALYASRGINLARFQGNSTGLLPIPATFVVDAEGCIRARFVDPDFRRRMAIPDIVESLRGDVPGPR